MINVVSGTQPPVVLNCGVAVTMKKVECGTSPPKQIRLSLRPLWIGLLLGAFLAGIALSAILTLFLQKQGSNTISVITVAMTSSITTVTTTTATTTTTTTTTATTTTTTTSTTTTSTTTTTTSTTTTTTTKTTTTTSKTTTTTSQTTTTMSGLNVNLVTNGDAETGPCEAGNDTNSPAGWSFSGPISQLCYNNTKNNSIFVDQTLSTPGPSNRGKGFFFGHISLSTSMWQTVDFSNRIDPLLIDNQLVNFNLSAWMGGITNQDDGAMIYLSFGDANNQIQGSSTTLGPVTADDRTNDTSLIFQKANGVVPAGARFLTILVTMTRASGSQNNGDVDNIAVVLY